MSGGEGLFEHLVAGASQPNLPSGWTWLTAEAWAGVTPREDLTTYFNGGDPQWDIISNPHLPRLELANVIFQRTRRRITENKSGFEILVAPSGEGKTTALMQSVVALTKDNSDAVALWRSRSNADLSEELIEIGLNLGSRCVIASDNAHTLLSSMDRLIRHAAITPSSGIQFLFASRDTDWARAMREAKLTFDPTRSWQRTGFLVQTKYRFGRVSADDANKIVKSWFATERTVPRSVEGLTHSEAAQRLEVASYSSRPGSGALLGALLSTRYTPEGLRAHLLDLLADFANDDLPNGKSMADIVVVVAALAVTGLEGLPIDIACEYCDIDRAEFRTLIERRLAEEVPVSSVGDFIHERHPEISRVILDVSLRRDAAIEVERDLTDLVNKTANIGARKGFRTGYGEIFSIGRRFAQMDLTEMDESRVLSLAVAISKEVQAVQPARLSSYQALSVCLRRSTRLDEAMHDVWLPICPRLSAEGGWKDWDSRARGTFNEFATVMSLANGEVDAATLRLASLSDLCGPEVLTSETVGVALNGLAVSLTRLLDAGPNDVLATTLGQIDGVFQQFIPDDPFYQRLAPLRMVHTRQLSSQFRGLDSFGQHLRKTTLELSKRGFRLGALEEIATRILNEPFEGALSLALGGA